MFKPSQPTYGQSNALIIFDPSAAFHHHVGTMEVSCNVFVFVFARAKCKRRIDWERERVDLKDFTRSLSMQHRRWRWTRKPSSIESPHYYSMH